MVDTGQGGFAAQLDLMVAVFDGNGAETSNEILPSRGKEPRDG